MDEEIFERIPVIRVYVSRSLISVARYNVQHVAKTYMYFMLLLKLGWMLSGCHLKMYITNAQLRLAKTGQAFCWIFSFVAGDSRWVHNVGVGVVLVMLGGSMLSLARASITRAKT